MKTVLGLSVTAAGVGWVLVDGSAAGAGPLDDDQFTVRDLDELLPRCVAAVRGAAAIAASTGRRISSIGVCWSAEVEDRMAALLAELRAAGYADVRPVRQVTPVPRPDSEVPLTARADRVDPCGLLAEMLASVSGSEIDADDDEAFGRHDMTGGPDAGQTPAYAAGQAVVTDAAPPAPIAITRPRRTWTPPKVTAPNWRPRVPAVPNWRLPVPAGRASTAAAAVAVTALVALFAVGSQFVGSGTEQPGEAALAGRSSASTAETTAVVRSAPPAPQPMAAAPNPGPVQENVSTPPVQLALPQPRPVVQQPSATAEAPVSAEPLAAPEVAATEVVAVAESVPVPDAVPAVPEPPAVVAEPATPVAEPLLVEPAAAPPAEILPPAPVAPPPPPPFWLLPPFVPPVPVEAPPAPVPAEVPPPPAPPADPVLSALP
ncbi:hypothetical protein [Mycolicibacterium diernhoferi]|nr:hypothetical protein [Mycolicibacterium diernhoferi]QYL20685.1 hypothetical protein K0O62_16515 [Mycolicibacterium diernhoferi]